MVLDSLSSPHRRSQNIFFVSSSKKPQSSRDDSWSALVERHRFLLTTLLVLAFLCSIYLYFAVTLGASDACSGLTGGAQKIECQARSVLQHGKLKFRWLRSLIDEDQIIEFICTLVTGLILHTMNLYIIGGGWFVFMLMLLGHNIYCTGRDKSNSDSVEFVESGNWYKGRSILFF